MAKEDGIVMQEQDEAWQRELPEAADQPMRGGMPPTNAPTHVFVAETSFKGVYTPA